MLIECQQEFTCMGRSNNEKSTIERITQIVTGLCRLLFPLMVIVGFAVHPLFWTFKRESDATVQFGYIQNSWGWTFGHLLVFFSIPN